jgi:hypothetical protein
METPVTDDALATVVEPTDAPWKKSAGYLHNEPLHDAWREAMEANRRRLDEDPEAA